MHLKLPYFLERRLQRFKNENLADWYFSQLLEDAGIHRNAPIETCFVIPQKLRVSDLFRVESLLRGKLKYGFEVKEISVINTPAGYLLKTAVRYSDDFRSD